MTMEAYRDGAVSELLHAAALCLSSTNPVVRALAVGFLRRATRILAGTGNLVVHTPAQIAEIAEAVGQLDRATADALLALLPTPQPTPRAH